MKFDLTYNYAVTDRTIDENRVYYLFGELVKNLITLSSAAERQAEIIGMGAWCDEMAIDFDSYFTHCCYSYVEYKLLTQEQVEMLKELDAYFDLRSGDKCPEFWDDLLLGTNPEWGVVRQKAGAILQSLGMQDLIIEFDREEKYEMTDKGKQIISQSTKTRLERKSL